MVGNEEKVSPEENCSDVAVPIAVLKSTLTDLYDQGIISKDRLEGLMRRVDRLWKDTGCPAILGVKKVKKYKK